jgi:hypothetical protein
MLAEEKLDDVRARVDLTPRKSLKLLTQEIGASKSSARKKTQLLSLDAIKNAHPRLAVTRTR